MQGRAHDLGIETDHRDKEEQSGKRGQWPCDHAGDDRITIAGQVPDDGQDNDRADEVVAGVNGATAKPSGHRPAACEAAGNAVAEMGEREQDEQSVDRVEQV